MKIYDGLRSLISNLGNPLKDKAAATSYGYTRLTDDQLIAAYATSWAARKLINVPAGDMLRKWRAWQGEDVTKVIAEEERLKLKSKLLEAKIKARLFGGAGIFIGTDQDLTEPLSVERLQRGGIRYLTVLGRRELVAGEIETDPLSEYYNRPKYYTVAGSKNQTQIHPSHFAILMGEPNMSVINDGWGLPVLQHCLDAVKNADGAAANIASMIFEANVDVIGIPDLTSNLANGGAEFERQLLARFALFAQGKGVAGVGILDKEEEYTRNAVNFGTLPELLEKFIVLVGAADGIPVSRFLGTSATGLNATGEGDMEVYFDKIQAMQSDLESEIYTLDTALLRSAGVDPALNYAWNPLEQANAAEEAMTNKTTTESLININNLGTYSSDEMRSIATRALGAFGVAEIVAETEQALAI
jgi:hypothetical protein